MVGKKEDQDQARRNSGKSTAREYLESLVVAFILALFVRTFVVQAFKIPTGSMENNLLIGDHLLVNKLVYAPTWSAIENKLLPTKAIGRGHVVVFKYPDTPTRDFIKRVIGLPGETVEIRDKVVYINGKPLVEPYVRFTRPVVPRNDPSFSIENEEWDNWGPQVVPKGHLFVMGDNRDNSSDSRKWGFLPCDQVKGRALLVYWSYRAEREEFQSGNGNLQWLRDTLTAFGRTRWNRFFHLIR